MPWSKTSDALWIANALFVSCLLCAVWAIISTIQAKSILDDLPAKEDLNTSLADVEVMRMQRTILRYKRTPAFQHCIMLFIWQFPSMAMAYSWVTFLLALTVHVCDPFVRHSPWSDKNKVGLGIFAHLRHTKQKQTAIVYLVVGLLGLATYVFTAVFVYMSEKDLEHYITDTTKKRSLETSTCIHAPKSPPTLPTIARMSGSSNGDSFERFRKEGFVEVDLERQAGMETIRVIEGFGPEKKKKTRLTLFN
jgi:hypothetical protein